MNKKNYNGIIEQASPIKINCMYKNLVALNNKEKINTSFLYSRTNFDDFLENYRSILMGKIFEKTSLFDVDEKSFNITENRLIFNIGFEEAFNKYFSSFLENNKYKKAYNKCRVFNDNEIEEEEVNVEHTDKGTKTYFTPISFKESLLYWNEDSIFIVNDIGESDCLIKSISKDDKYASEIASIIKKINDDSKNDPGDKTFVKMSFFSGNDREDMIVPLKDAKFYVDLPFANKKHLEDFSKAEEPILILQGVPGSGKTSLIRYFINKYRSQYEFMVIKSADILMSESFWVDLIRDFDSVAPHCLILDDFNVYGGSSKSTGRDFIEDIFDSLLSITGGLFSIDFKMIISTNTQMIFSKAIKRKGRTFDILKFRNLMPNEINYFIDEYNKNSEIKLKIPLKEELMIPLSPAEIISRYKEE